MNHTGQPPAEPEPDDDQLEDDEQRHDGGYVCPVCGKVHVVVV